MILMFGVSFMSKANVRHLISIPVEGSQSLLQHQQSRWQLLTLTGVYLSHFPLFIHTSPALTEPLLYIDNPAQIFV